MINVLILSKKTLTAELLARAVSSQTNFKLVEFATTDEELFQILVVQRVDVVLFVLPLSEDEAWINVLRRIRVAAPRTRVIVLGESGNATEVVSSFTAGARGFFSLHDSSVDQLVKCIARVHEGQIWANAAQMEWMLQVLERARPGTKPFSVVNAFGERLLSQREEEVVSFLLDGLQNRDIARALNLSEHTIKNYLFRIYDKLGISNRTELVLYAMTPHAIEQQFKAG